MGFLSQRQRKIPYFCSDSSLLLKSFIYTAMHIAMNVHLDMKNGPLKEKHTHTATLCLLFYLKMLKYDVLLLNTEY